MKIAAIPMLAILPLAAQVTPTAALKVGGTPVRAAKIAQGTFTGLEKRFDQQLGSLFSVNDPLDLLGNTRGVYLDGYGVVFTAEVSPIVTPTLTPFRPKITPELAESVRKRKLERLPVIKTAMKEMLRSMALTFIRVPDSQQMVLVVRFYYEQWENLNGVPSQILMRADRKSAMTRDIHVDEQ